jgi:hypothetical protein
MFVSLDFRGLAPCRSGGRVDPPPWRHQGKERRKETLAGLSAGGRDFIVGISPPGFTLSFPCRD